MSHAGLNLARRPFVNRRPVRRLAGLLWVLALALLVFNVSVYWRHVVGSGGQEEELTALAAEVEGQTAALEAAVARLEGYDLEWQTEQIEYLNARIAERTFAWSALFDDLAEVLPDTVRLQRVTPRFGQDGTGGGRRSDTESRMGEQALLELTGASEDDEVLLVLVDAFYAHDRFFRPDLQVESRRDAGGLVEFSMNVGYRPAPIVPPAREAKDGQGDGETDSEGATPAAAPAEVES